MRGMENAKYFFEHRLLPNLLYNRSLDEEVLERSGDDVLYQLFDKVCRNHNLKNPYKKNPYKTEKICVAGCDFRIWRITMPPTDKIPLCKRIYIIFSDSPAKMGYYTAENGENHSTFLCGWSFYRAHMNFGYTPTPLSAELKKIVEVHTKILENAK